MRFCEKSKIFAFRIKKVVIFAMIIYKFLQV